MVKILLIICSFCLALSAWAQKHILVLHSYDMTYAWTETMHNGMMKELVNLPPGYEVHVEYMDTKRFKDQAYFENLAKWYQTKYSNFKFDIVLTADDDAFNFYMKYYSILFPQSALFFCGKGTFDESILKTHPLPIRGVMEFIDLLDSLRIASKLHNTKKAYYIVDNSTTGIIQHEKWMKAFREELPDFDITSLHLAYYSFDEVIEKVKTLKEGVILLNVVGQDRLGNIEDNLVMTKKISAVSQIPIYVESSMRVGLGTIGGRVIDGERHGGLVAKKLVDYTQGIDEPPFIDARNNNLLMFSYPELVRFNVDLQDLPRESIIINRPISVYEFYKSFIWVVGILLLIMLVVIAIQTVRIQNRRQFQAQLESLVEKRTEELNQQIVEQKKLRKTLISREKLASLGNLTAGIAHEIKNPLNIIINSAQVIESRAKLVNEQESKALVDIRRMTQLIVKNSYRADSIIQNMLGQVSTAEAPLGQVNINNLIEEALALVYHASVTKYEMNVSIQKNLGMIPEIILSKENVLRALINLIENSFYALNEKKLKQASFKPNISVSTFTDHQRLIIEIEDNGTGIPSEVVEKVLNPFFTTKPAGVGTGLGLSMVNDIVSSHGGEVDIKTQEGEFTLIRMIFPLR